MAPVFAILFLRIRIELQFLTSITVTIRLVFFKGTALTDHEMSGLHCEKITSLQRAAFKHLRDDLLDFCMGNVANVDKRESLIKLFGVLRYFLCVMNFSLANIFSVQLKYAAIF